MKILKCFLLLLAILYFYFLGMWCEYERFDKVLLKNSGYYWINAYGQRSFAPLDKNEIK